MDAWMGDGEERALRVQGRVGTGVAGWAGLGVGLLALAALAVVLAWAAGVAGLAWGLAWLLLEGAAAGLALPVAAAVVGVGGLALAAALRPVVAPPVDRAGRLALGPREAPALRRFLNEVAVALRVRPPRLLAVDAGVGVRIEGGRLVLGLALVASARREVLAALVGAELARAGGGHSAGQCGAFVDQVQAWLARGAAGRDRWAPAMEALASGRGWWRLGWPLAWVDRGVRRVLLGLQAGLGWIGAGFARQQRLAADAQAARLVGRAVLGEALALERRLAAVARAADQQQMVNAFERGRLCADLPRLVALERGQGRVGAAEGFDAVRLQAVAGLEVSGLVADSRPAAGLVPGFAELCQAVTRARYAGWMRHAEEPLQLVDPEAFRESQAAASAELGLLDGFLAGGRPASQRVLAAAGPAALEADPVGALQRLRARCLTAGADLEEARREWLARDVALQGARQAAELAAMGVAFELADYGLAGPKGQRLEPVVAALRQARQEAQARLEALEGQVTQRLALAGALGFDPVRSQRLPQVAAARARLPGLWALGAGLQAAQTPLEALHDGVMLLAVHSQQGRDPRRAALALERAAEAWAGLWALLPEGPCPLDPAVSVRAWVLGAQRLASRDAPAVFAAYRRAVPRFDAVAWRVLADQATLAQGVEAALLDGRAPTFEPLPGVDLSALDGAVGASLDLQPEWAPTGAGTAQVRL